METAFVNQISNVFLYVLNKGYLMYMKTFIKLKIHHFTA